MSMSTNLLLIQHRDGAKRLCNHMTEAGGGGGGGGAVRANGFIAGAVCGL